MCMNSNNASHVFTYKSARFSTSHYCMELPMPTRYHLLSPWRTAFNISCTAGLLVSSFSCRMFVDVFFCFVLESRFTGYRILHWSILFFWGLRWCCSTVCSAFSTGSLLSSLLCFHSVNLLFYFLAAFRFCLYHWLWAIWWRCTLVSFSIILMLGLPWASWIYKFSSSMINIWLLFLPAFFCPTSLPPPDTPIKHV